MIPGIASFYEAMSTISEVIQGRPSPVVGNLTLGTSPGVYMLNVHPCRQTRVARLFPIVNKIPGNAKSQKFNLHCVLFINLIEIGVSVMFTII